MKKYKAKMTSSLYNAPWKYSRFLREDPSQRANPYTLQSLSPSLRAKVNKIHRQICSLPYREDIKDVWEIKSGDEPRDCDDKVLEERMILGQSIPMGALRPQLCTVPTSEGWKGHMVLILTLSDNDLVLDSNIIMPLPYTAFQYKWYSRCYDNEQWQRPVFYGGQAS